MKRILSILVLTALTASCTTDDNHGNPGEGKNRVVLTFEGDYWNALIDNPQYGGALLYGETPYYWYDETTDLEHQASNSEWSGVYYPSAWMGVSNYQSIDYALSATSQEQLAVYASAMHSGTNCVVCSGYKSSWDDSRPTISFRGGAAFVESVWVANTCYSYASAVGGLNDYTPALTTTQSIWIQATGYTLDAEGNDVEGSSLDFYLYKNGQAEFSGWQKWDLSGLGEVNKVKFDVQWNGEGGADNFLHPAYFALDDITIVRP